MGALGMLPLLLLLLLLLIPAMMSSTAAEQSQDHASQMKRAVNSLNKLLDYMLEPRSVIGDLIFGVVLARGKPKNLQVSLQVARYTHIYTLFLQVSLRF